MKSKKIRQNKPAPKQPFPTDVLLAAAGIGAIIGMVFFTESRRKK